MINQKNNGIKEPKKLLQDISTRWNSTFYMLEHFRELETPIRGTLGLLDYAPIGLNLNEWVVIKKCLQVLQPFEEATRVVGGEQYVSFNGDCNCSRFAKCLPQIKPSSFFIAK